ncbi:MAG: DUF1330 domain-containing protein [Erythrobacter sp.]
MAEPGAFLIIRTTAPDNRFRDFRGRISAKYMVVGSARLHEAAALEPGTMIAHTLVIAFPDKDIARAAWAAMPRDIIAEPAVPQVLLTGALPPEGLPDPDIPTRANATLCEDDGPVLLLIEGTGTDEDRMNQYRGILLPLMFELNAYYTVFDLGGDVEVLSGDWDEAIFAISRWPSRAAAEEFWMCDRYQKEAIPIRLHHGEFQVTLIPEVHDG